MKEQVLGMFERVRALLSDPKRWTKGEYARDLNGTSVSVLSRDADTFCLLGAIIKENYYESTEINNDIYFRIGKYCPQSITEANDKQWTHEQMLATVDNMINDVKKEIADEKVNLASV